MLHYIKNAIEKRFILDLLQLRCHLHHLKEWQLLKEHSIYLIQHHIINHKL